MQGLDAYLHVPDPIFKSPYKGLIMIFNPSSDVGRLEDNTWIRIPLYYSGLTKVAHVSVEGDPVTKRTYHLARDYSITVQLNLKPESFTWLLIEDH